MMTEPSGGWGVQFLNNKIGKYQLIEFSQGFLTQIEAIDFCQVVNETGTKAHWKFDLKRMLYMVYFTVPGFDDR